MAEDSDIPEKFRTKEDVVPYICGWNAFTRPSPWQLFKWKLEPNNSSIPWKDLQAIQEVHPVLKYASQKVYNPPQDKIQITWIGHATVLVQIEGMNILADPVFSDKSGPAGFGLQLGYKRFRPPACQVKDLPPIDVVIISHNHHDHLDSQSIEDIAKHHPDAKWLVGSGNAKFCKKYGCKDVEELKWWQAIRVGDITLVCTPTQHWCQRYPLDFNHALWCGWVVKSPNYKYYFAGDSGYQYELFKLIGRKYGPFDLTSIPIGGYEPRYITEFVSMNPEEAVKVHMDIHSIVSIGINWGTFELTNEYYLEPPQELEKQMYNKGLDPKTFFNLRIGETWIVGEDRDYDPPFMERENAGTQRLSNGPGDVGATCCNQHVGMAELVEASGVLTVEEFGGDRDYDPPFMERRKTETPSLNNGRLDGDLGGYIWKPALSECESHHLHRIDPLCQDIKMESQGKQTERSNPREISPDQPWPHNNQEDSVTGMKPTGRSKPKRMALDAPWTHNNKKDYVTGMKSTGYSKPRSMALDALWTHNNQEDYVTGIKPTGRSTIRGMALDAPWTHNNQEDSVTGMKPTGRSKPRRRLSPDASSQRKNQDSASSIKPTGRSARD